MKLAVFCENAHFCEIRDFSAFTFIYEAVRVFDFKQVSLLPCDVLIKKIPGADSRHVLAEFTAYKAIAGGIALETSVVSFWHASSDRFPLLSCLALRYLSVPTDCVDAEKSISQYTNVSARDYQQATWQIK